VDVSPPGAVYLSNDTFHCYHPLDQSYSRNSRLVLRIAHLFLCYWRHARILPGILAEILPQSETLPSLPAQSRVRKPKPTNVIKPSSRVFGNFLFTPSPRTGYFF
jgi:hypothetical protein